MKLRIQGNSLRLRLTPDEVDQLAAGGRVAETLTLGAGEEDHLTYALEARPRQAAIALAWDGRELTVSVPEATARAWATGSEVGLYADLSLGGEVVQIEIEKDFAFGR